MSHEQTFMGAVQEHKQAAALAMTGAALAGALSWGLERASADTSTSSQTVTSADQLPNSVKLAFPGSESIGGSGEALAADVATGNVTVLSYIHANGLTKKYETAKRCQWVSGVYNSGETINGPEHPTKANQVAWFYDPRETKVCEVPKKVSPTGFAKAGNRGPGGKVIDDCGNFVKFTPPKHVVEGRVILVKNRAKAMVNIVAKAKAHVVESCGEATAYARSKVMARVETYVRGHGNRAVRIYNKLHGEAAATAAAEVTCGPTPTATTTVTTTTSTPPSTPPTTYTPTPGPTKSAKPTTTPCDILTPECH